MATISLKNVGPVEQFSFTVPEGGGVVVFKARNGRGKSHTLNAIDSLAGGKGKVPLRDMARSGEVEGFGAELTVGKSTRRAGEVEVETLEGRLNLADLVDPGIADPERADAARIKALLQLAAVEADPALFYGLLGGKKEFEDVCDPKAEDADLLAMAKRIKREIEKEALETERLSAAEGGKAQALRAACAGVDLNANCDQDALQAALEAAIREEARLHRERDASNKAQADAKATRERFEKAKAEYAGPSVEDCQSAHTRAVADKSAAQREFEDARARLDAATDAVTDAEKSLVAAQQHAKLIQSLEDALNSAIPAAPLGSDLDKAADAVSKAREALATAGAVTKAKADTATAKEHADRAQRLKARGEALRTAAGKIDEVLSAQVGKLRTPLRVDDGRLVIDTPRGQKTLYCELSHGERWKVAIDLAADIVGPGGIIVIPQEAWEGIDPINRKAIADHARSRGVTIFTAECSGDEELVAATL